MGHVKVSVIVPIYNVEEYVEECLLSLKMQTLKEIEVLMIDDGSLDHSADIAKRFAHENDNFHYFYKENGGLGNARNFAIPYVKGDYLIFLDSDDIVPKDAYEKMYNLAVKTGNDMIIGNVMRFNSTKVYDSALHKKVFDDDYEHIHILDKPDLVYDTTSWNKLFKTSFYKENNFKFPEKILYEDIPVTIPAHFKANSVGIITDICYLWRTRDGVSKSITQNRTEIKNFTDRIKIMDMVNDFYEKNVTDETALLMKDYKWLDVDLKLYINQFIDASEEYRQIAFKEINRYLQQVNSKSFDMLRSIDKMKYHYIQQNDINGLLNLLEYQKTSFKSLRIHKTKKGYIGDFPMKEIPVSLKNMTKELEFYPVVQAVQKVTFKDTKLFVDCLFYIARLKRQDEFDVKAYLYNRERNQKVEINIERKPSSYLTSKRGYRFSRHPLKIVKYDYSQCAYSIMIDFHNKDVMNVLKGNTFIQIEYKNEFIYKTFFLGKSDEYSLNLIQSTFYNQMLIHTHLVNKGNFQIMCDENVTFLNNVNVDNEKININICEPRFYIEHGDKKIKFNVCHEKQSLSLKDIPYGIYYFKSLNDKDTLVTYDGQSIFTKDSESVVFIENDKNGSLKISKFESRMSLEDLLFDHNKLTFKVRSSYHYQNNALDLVLENKNYNYKLFFSPITVEKLEDSVIYTYSINLNNETEIENIALGNYEFYIQENPSCIYELYTPTRIYKQKLKAFDREFKFEVIDNQMYMNVKHFWKKYENSPKKRRIIMNYVYPILRKLPIKKKCIVFEGWWGEKYHCNPRYFYEYVNKNYPQYECIWMLKDNYIPIQGNGKRIRRKSMKYYYYLAVAKYFINNVNFHDEYVKRKGQIEIQTMHGTPLKTLGLDVPGELDDPVAREKFLRRCDRWNYLVVQSHKASEITASCYAFKKEFLRTGYPRNDILFEKNNPHDIHELKKKMGIPTDKKVIMYAPTWRKRNYFEMKLDLDDMKKTFGENYILILRIHPFAYPGFDRKILNDFVYNFSAYESVEELYLVSDLVITDYSSVMFDYTILNRPIMFFTYDLKEYRDYLRGFNFDFEAEAPGPMLENYSDVKKAILNLENVSQQYDEKLQKFRNKFNEYETGTASQQIFEKVFKSQ